MPPGGRSVPVDDQNVEQPDLLGAPPAKAEGGDDAAESEDPRLRDGVTIERVREALHFW